MNRLVHLLEHYEASGYKKAGEVLLDARTALQFLDELEKLGVIIFGIDLWRFYGPDRTGLGEYTHGMNMDDISSQQDAAKRTADAARQFLAMGLPEEVDLVSFVIDDTSEC